MFCEKCGTRVDDGQAFCPNCGNRLAAPAAPAYANPAPNPAPAAPGFGTVPPAPGYNPMPRQPRQPGEPLLGTLFDNFKELPTLLKIFLPIILGLICLNMLLTNGNPLSYSFYGYSLAVASFQEAGATWALLFINLFLQIFGWSIVMHVGENGLVTNVYPARTGYRGFGPEELSRAYVRVTEFLVKNGKKLLEEARG